MSSWWWVEIPHETCRAVYRYKWTVYSCTLLDNYWHVFHDARTPECKIIECYFVILHSYKEIITQVVITFLYYTLILWHHHYISDWWLNNNVSFFVYVHLWSAYLQLSFSVTTEVNLSAKESCSTSAMLLLYILHNHCLKNYSLFQKVHHFLPSSVLENKLHGSVSSCHSRK